MIVIGLYSVLWGKHKEKEEDIAEEIPDPIKGDHVNGNTVSMIEDIEANEVALHKAEAKKISPVAICMPEIPPSRVHQEP